MATSTAVDQSAVARVLGIETNFLNLKGGVSLLPQRIGLIGQGASLSTYATTKQQITSASQAGTLYGFGSPIHLAAKQLFPANGDGVGTIPVTVYPLEDAATGVAATGDITPSGTQTVQASYLVRINNIDSEAFVISVGDSVATIVTAMTTAINANVDMPVIAVDSTTQVDLTAKWEGVSSNDITIEVVGSTTAGTTFTITTMSGGLVNPSVQTALDQVGDVWETIFVNCLDIADTTNLALYDTFGEGRWGALVRKPCVVLTGNTASTVTSATTVSDARPNDRTNGQCVSPGSNDLPCVVAARQVARIAVRANENPPFDYGSLKATGLTPGDDSVQWDYLERDQAVKAGSSTIEVEDGVVKLSDTITFYKPSGEEFPAYRYVVDIMKLANILFNLDLIFNTDEWDGAPLIPDDQPTTNRDAKKPLMAKAAIAELIDALALEAIISDPETAKSTIQAQISSSNPKRLEWSVTMQISGNSNIISGTFNWGFYFGTDAIVA